MHPRSLRSGLYIPTTSVTETLFGPDFEVEEYELAVLWKASPRSKKELKIDLYGGGS